MAGDYEWKLVEALAQRLTAESGVKVQAIAGALPAELPEVSLQAVPVGGRTGEPGIAYPVVSLHLRTKSEGDAAILAGLIPRIVLALDAERIHEDSVNIVGMELESMPYVNFDPLNPGFFRYSCQTILTIKIG
ncbi:MAG: hypothetical protein Q4D87_08985 [Actinomycetaceae bacterium]|nr:hypothetical protein [Actinomycetaceae bacterium]